MNLSDICCPECITLDPKSKSKADAIREMAELAAQSGRIDSVEDLMKALLEREELKTTGVGHGVAIPHATAKGVKGLILALGVSKSGIDYDALDEKPVHIMFLLAGEPRLQTSFLSILSKISRIFRKKTTRQELINAANPGEAHDLIQAFENR